MTAEKLQRLAAYRCTIALFRKLLSLNMASAVEAEKGTLDGEEEISSLLGEARTLLEKHERRDGYYAFVASKCAPVYRYFGHFRYAKELEERSERIYEGA